MEVVISPARFADLHQAANVLNRAFVNDAGTNWVYGYPSASAPNFSRALAQSLPPRRVKLIRRHLYNPSMRIFTAKVGTHVVGLSIWAAPDTQPLQQRSLSVFHRLVGMLLQAYDRLCNVVFPIWLQIWLDPWLAGFLVRRKKIKDIDLTPPKAVIDAGYWELQALGVLPEFEGRGIGAKLLLAGSDLADEKGRAVVMTASAAGERLYLKHGFIPLQRGMVLEDEPGGPIFHSYMMRPGVDRNETRAALT